MLDWVSIKFELRNLERQRDEATKQWHAERDRADEKIRQWLNATGELAAKDAQIVALREALEQSMRWHNGSHYRHSKCAGEQAVWRQHREVMESALSSPPPPVVKLEDVRPLVEAITSLTNLIICPDDHREENPCRYCDGQTDAENLLKTFLTTYPQLNS
jgi:hypothetical protein